MFYIINGNIMVFDKTMQEFVPVEFYSDIMDTFHKNRLSSFKELCGKIPEHPVIRIMFKDKYGYAAGTVRKLLKRSNNIVTDYNAIMKNYKAQETMPFTDKLPEDINTYAFKAEQYMAIHPNGCIVYVVTEYSDIRKELYATRNAKVFVYDARKNGKEWVSNLYGPFTPEQYLNRKYCNSMNKLDPNSSKYLEYQMLEDKYNWLDHDQFAKFLAMPEEERALTNKYRVRSFTPNDDHFDADKYGASEIELSGMSDMAYIKYKKPKNPIDEEILQLEIEGLKVEHEWLKTLDPDVREDLLPYILPLDNKICPYCGELYNILTNDKCPNCGENNPFSIISNSNKDPDWIAKSDSGYEISTNNDTLEELPMDETQPDEIDYEDLEESAD